MIRGASLGVGESSIDPGVRRHVNSRCVTCSGCVWVRLSLLEAQYIVAAECEEGDSNAQTAGPIRDSHARSDGRNGSYRQLISGWYRQFGRGSGELREIFDAT
jgi:hypothetical protein